MVIRRCRPGSAMVTTDNAGHVLQEDQGPAVAEELLAYMAESPLTSGERLAG